MKVSQKPAKTTLQPSRKSRFKKPPRDLNEWIRLANLVTPNTRLPDLWTSLGEFSWKSVVDLLARFEEPLRSELLNYLPAKRVDQWIRDNLEGRASAEYVRWIKVRPEEIRVRETLEHYDRIRIAAQLLRIISRDRNDRPMDALETLVSTLRYADLSYIRQCAYEPCGKIFYAGKSTQHGCTPEHSSNVRKRKKRERDRLNAETTKKRAKKARKH